MLYGAVGHEFKMNESALSMYILNKLSLHGNIHKAKLYIAWWMKALWPETPKKLTLYFSRNNSLEFAYLWFTVTFWSITTANNENGLYLVYLQALLHPVSITRDLLHNCCKKWKYLEIFFKILTFSQAWPISLIDKSGIQWPVQDWMRCYRNWHKKTCCNNSACIFFLFFFNCLTNLRDPPPPTEFSVLF